MKSKIFIIIPALIYGIIFTSCNSDKADPQYELKDKLYVMGAKSASTSSKDKLDLLFTSDDIKMFKTSKPVELADDDAFIGEIVFADMRADDLVHSFGLYTTVYFYIGETLLFDPPIKLYSPVSSISPDDLCMSIYNDKFILREFYQTWSWLPAFQRAAKLKAQEKKSKMRKKQLDVFFKYLNDKGKLVN